MKSIIPLFLLAIITTTDSCVQESRELPEQDYKTHVFGEGGQIKMLYDRRQRPQSIYLNELVYIVFNAGGSVEDLGRSPTRPMIVTFDPAADKFSETVVLGPADNDHHYGPVIWADTNDYLHVLYGCHSSPGTHMISREPGKIGSSIDDWKTGPEIAPSISYPTLYRVTGDQTLIYYRTRGHISSWTYRTSDDHGMSWTGPENDVTDLDSRGRFEWSSYQSRLPSKDGRYLHVVFIAYDDNRQSDSARYYNPRYQKNVSNEWKYNLYYVKIDLESGEVSNFDGDQMSTPIDLDQADSKCRIWNTDWRGAGVPPDIVLDADGNPAFLHVLSEETTEQHHYYFVHRSEGKWEKTLIAPSNHQWNSCHVNLDNLGVYHAYLVMGHTYIDTKWVEGKDIGTDFKKGEVNYLNTGGYMDKHGGGRIVEWISVDKGKSWQMKRDLTPDSTHYPGWRFNNVQAVTDACGNAVDGMLMFYGWKDPEAPAARGFLLNQHSHGQELRP